MKRAFTLVELLVVIATIAILIAMVFRVGNVAAQYSARNLTVDRLQRLENALSGYYAAYGTYPPVKNHNLPDIFIPVGASGVQLTDRGRNTELVWAQVQAACQSQPIGCYFPMRSDEAGIRRIVKYSQKMKKYANKHRDEISEEKYNQFMAGFDTGCSPSASRFSKFKDVEDWTEVQLFKFGLMSYLLPRYLVMMNGHADFITYRQWTGNNEIPSNPLTGKKDWAGEDSTDEEQWAAMKELATEEEYEQQAANAANSSSLSSANSLSLISSQSVCSRWIANFEKSLVCASGQWVFYGVDVQSNVLEHPTDVSKDMIVDGMPNLNLTIYTPGGGEGTAEQYILDSITFLDGWGCEFYYYSPPPYQSYIAWSSGPNMKTFPPWLDRRNLNFSSQDEDRVNTWIEDDIIGLKK